MMPVVGSESFFGRPASITSGTSLENKVVIQRRSDVLLEEQADNVRNVQESLDKVLTELDHARTQVEEDFCRSQAEELKLRCDEMMVVLKIINKVNAELAYARAELQRALREGCNIMTARKRVNWLEDRIERMLGKDKRREPSRAQIRSAALGDDEYLQHPAEISGEQPPDAGSTRGFSSMGASDVSMGDTSPRSNARRVDILTGLGGDDLLPRDVTRDIPVIELTRTSPDQIHRQSTPEVVFPDADLGQKLDESQDVDDLSSGRSSSISSSSSSSLSSSSSDSTSEIIGRLPETSRFSPDNRAGDHRNDDGNDEDDKAADEMMPDSVGVDDDGEETASGRQSAVTSQASIQAPVFITEGASDGELLPSRDDARSTRSRCSRVTIKSPVEFEELTSERGHVGGEDTDDYWKTEHHRFEYNEYADALLEINPLSYHQMGLAVPGTFVADIDRDVKLPWRPSSGGAMAVDIHKQALDKLSLKVHKMYGRVKEASMLSVEQLKEKEFGAPTLFQNLEDLSQREGTAETSKARSGSRTPAHKSRDGLTLPPLENNRIGSSLSGRLLYYPKPLPYPDKLPLTRLNASKQFPPSSDVFSSSVPGEDPAAERIVNQRNLHKETKFTSSLFKSKATKKNKLSSSEENFQAMLLEQAKLSNQKQSQLSMKSALKMATSAIRLSREGAINLGSMLRASHKDGPESDPATTKWKDMKPKSGFLDHSGLKWERVKNIVHNSLESMNTEERLDAARHLGALKCGDTMVIYALRLRLQTDPEQRVVYESMKALILLGCWDREVIEKLVHFMRSGNSSMKEDILKTIKMAKNTQYVDKRHNSFSTLAKIISGLCVNSDPEDSISFLAAVCLGRLCVIDDNAISKLRQVMKSTTNTHDRAQSLDILVRQMNEHDHVTVAAVLDQLRNSPVWKHRLAAASHLVTIGARHVTKNEQADETFDLLERRLWDEPNKEVRHEVAKALAAQELFAKACEKTEKQLSDASENVRAQAVISIGTLGMKAERIIRLLLEMMELDGSDYVRLMILRTFGVLAYPDKRILRLVKDKEKGDGPLTREAKKTLDRLSSLGKDGKGNRAKKVGKEH